MRKIIISAFLAVLGMPIEMYGERRRRVLQARRPNMQYVAGLGRAQGMQRHLNYIHSMKYAEVINTSIAANSAGYSIIYVVCMYIITILVLYVVCMYIITILVLYVVCMYIITILVLYVVCMYIYHHHTQYYAYGVAHIHV